MLRLFMSPYTPYRSLLIYHEMGVGKSCTAITIAENLKSIVSKSNTKIYIIKPNEIERQLFNIENVKKNTIDNTCVGSTYVDIIKNKDEKHKTLVENCMKNNADSCMMLKNKITKEIKKTYTFNGPDTWVNIINREIELKTKNIDNEIEKELKKKSIIETKFNNSVIIIDEVHNIRETDKEKKFPPVLNMVLKYSKNVRLILLSGTPIYDKPQGIVSIINYLLLNDKKPTLNENDIFHSSGKLKANGHTLLENNIRGYISYMRGSNPFNFPIKLSAKYNIPKQMLNQSNYPSKDINGKPLNEDDKIKYLELVDCPFQGEQLKLINYYINNTKRITYDNTLLDTIDSEISIDDTTDKSIDDTPDKLQTTKVKHTIKKSEVSNKNNTVYKNTSVAFNTELQISNFIYQSINEANDNINLIAGTSGLQQISTQQKKSITYKFNNQEYGKRFKMPELKQWGIKIATILERILNSTGPVFIYTRYIDSGVIPLAFTLEMNGFKRYNGATPLLDNKYKDTSQFRGEYIIYSGNKSLSQYAEEYLNKGSAMINEKNVKVFIATAKASEGINLFGYREAHILDPWHNMNLIEQSIGRVVRTDSHISLPPQERNVSIYNYASTLKNKESFDLIIYKLAETKAVYSGIVEKILKENAFDCELNKEDNIYNESNYSKEIPLITSNNKQIKVSLADKPYTRNCFYMKECNYNCAHSSKPSSSQTNTKYDTIPIMDFMIEKDIIELKNSIKNLMKTHFNININNLKLYLYNLINGIDNIKLLLNKNEKEDTKDIKSKKIILKTQKTTKKTNMTDTNSSLLYLLIKNENYNLIFNEAFYKAIQDLINKTTIIVDKFNRTGTIAISGQTLRFIPNSNIIPNMSIEKQETKPAVNLITDINLTSYINYLTDKQKLLLSTTNYDYNEIINKHIIEKAELIFYSLNDREYKFNVTVNLQDIIEHVFHKLSYLYKKTVIKEVLKKNINNINLNVKEKKIDPILNHYIIYYKNIYPNQKDNNATTNQIYGFIIQNNTNLELWFYDIKTKEFIENSGNLKKVLEYKYNILNKTPNNNIYGFLKYEKNNIVFKNVDFAEKGEKKSVKGISCNTMNTSNIKKLLYKLDPNFIKNIKHNTRVAFCNDMEYLLKFKDNKLINKKKWFYTPEEYYIYFEYNV